MLQEILGQVLTSETVSQIGNQIGADENTTTSAIQLALPLLIGALSRNAASPQGADALHNAVTNDHDGSILDNIGGFLLNPQQANGAGMLGHIFGARQENVASEISQQSGLNIGQVAQILLTLAPIVLGALGKARNQQGLDSQGLANVLAGQQQQFEQPQSPIMNIATQLLDSDHDGSVVDDIAGLAAKFFAGK